MYVHQADFERIGADSRAQAHDGQMFGTEVELVRGNGRALWVDLKGVLLSEQTGEWLWMLVDISAIKQRRDEVETLAYHDALTGLPNRMLLMDRLNQALAAALRSQRYVAVAFADLDGFKQINDEHGHEAGDTLLRTVAGRLAGSMRAQDTVARLGGDEFVIVLGGLTSTADVEPVLARARAIVGQPVRVGPGLEVAVGASFGIAIAPDDGTDATTLIARADEAMYRVKRNRT